MENEGMERLIGSPDDYQWGNTQGETIEKDGLKSFLEQKGQNETAEAVKKYVPIGTVVKLQNEEKNMMVIGYCNNQNGVTFDYIGCIFPQGISQDSKMSVFNHTQIERIYHIGLVNDSQKDYKSELLSREGQNAPSQNQK